MSRGSTPKIANGFDFEHENIDVSYDGRMATPWMKYWYCKGSSWTWRQIDKKDREDAEKIAAGITVPAAKWAANWDMTCGSIGYDQNVGERTGGEGAAATAANATPKAAAATVVTATPEAPKAEGAAKKRKGGSGGTKHNSDEMAQLWMTLAIVAKLCLSLKQDMRKVMAATMFTFQLPKDSPAITIGHAAIDKYMDDTKKWDGTQDSKDLKLGIPSVHAFNAWISWANEFWESVYK